MSDYFATQRTGSACAPFNCAAASGAMALAAVSGNAITLTSDQFRSQAAVSCVPGAHSNSGGLFIADVERVIEHNGHTIDYGRVDDSGPRRWPPPELARRLSADEGAVILGDYDALPAQFRASVTFRGDHSAYAHDYRESAASASVCWHDPLRLKPIRIPISAVISYWQKPSSPVRGFAGFVEYPEDMQLDFRITRVVAGTATVTIDGAQLVTMTNGRVDIPKGQTREVCAEVEILDDIDDGAPVPGDRKNAYLVGRAVPVEATNVRAAFLLKSAAKGHVVKVEAVS